MSYDNNWYYDKQRDRKRIIERFNWDSFADGLTGPKAHRPKLSNIKQVDIPYKIVNKEGTGYESQKYVEMDAVRNSNLNSAARTIFKEQYDGIKREYEFVANKYDRALPGLIEEINTYSDKLGKPGAMEEQVEIVLSKFQKSGELKETFKKLAVQARKNPESLKKKAEDGKTEAEKFVEEFTRLLSSTYAFTGGKDKFLSLDSDLATKLKQYEIFSDKVLSGSVEAGDFTALSGHIWKLFSAPMEAMGAYAVAQYMSDFYDEMSEIVGGKATDKVAQGKTDFKYGSLNFSAKNYFANEKGSVGTISYHSGDLSKLLNEVGWTSQLQILYAYSAIAGDTAFKGFRTLVESVVSSAAIAGFPGDRVHLMIYINKVKPVYEYFDKDGTNVSVSFDKKSTTLDSLYNIVKSRHDVKLIGGEIKSRSRGGKFK